MKTIVASIAGPLFGLAVLAGCSTHLYSLPARTVPLESAEVLNKGKVAVAAEGGAGGMTFGPTVGMGTARLRLGMDEDRAYEGDVEANVLFVRDYVAVTARAGTKVRLWDFLALTAGMGVGGSSMGGFVSPDVGVVASYENPYVIPFASARVWVSQPFASQTLTLSDNGAIDGTLRDYEAGFTFGFSPVVGVRVPLMHEGQDERWSVAAAVGCNGMFNLEEGSRDTVCSLHGGTEVRF